MRKLITVCILLITVIVPFRGQILVRAGNDDKPQLVYLKVFNNNHSIDNYVRTGDVAVVELQSNKELQSAQILREGKVYKELISNGNLTIWNGELFIDENEGFDYLILQLRDTDNNVTVINPADYMHSELSKYSLKVDNHKPDMPIIDTAKWSSDWKDGGIIADGINPEVNRFSNNHVIRNNIVKLTGFVEANQRIVLYANGVMKAIVGNEDIDCALHGDEITTKDDLIVKYGNHCRFSYNFNFPDDGRNKDTGEPVHLYKFGINALDKAGNESILVNYPDLFHDSSKPLFR